MGPYGLGLGGNLHIDTIDGGRVSSKSILLGCSPTSKILVLLEIAS